MLALDTATSATAVALLADGLERPLEARDDPGPGQRPRHTPRVLALARDLLAEAGLSFAHVDRVAVGRGPGSFTGLRIGVATARALAQASGAELVGVSTLRALAVEAEALAQAGTLVLSVLDARRGEVFAAGWRAGEEALAPRALPPADLAALARAQGAGVRGPWLGVGDGAVRFSEQLIPAGVTVPEPSSALHRVSAVAVGRLGAAASPAPRGAVVPDYLRAPDAEMRVRATSDVP